MPKKREYRKSDIPSNEGSSDFQPPLKTRQKQSAVKQLEDQLDEEREKFRSLIEIIPALVFVKDKQNRTVDCNQYYADAMEQPKEKIINKSIENIFPNADLHYADDLEIIAYDKPKYNIINYQDMSKGKKLWLSTNKAPLKNKAGEIIGIIGCSLDISAQKKLEESLKEGQKEKELILDSISDLVTYLDISQRILWANKKVGEYLKTSPNELKNHYCYQIYHKRDKVCSSCPAKNALASGRQETKEMITPNGNIWRISAYPVKDLDGKNRGTVTISRNVTLQKQSEKKLKESEARYRFIFEGTQDAIAVVSSSAEILLTNEATSVLSGYNKDELMEMSILEMINKTEQELFMQLAERILSGEYIINELNIIRKHKVEMITEVRGTKIMIREKPCLHLVFRDISERKRARERLKNYQDHLEMMVEQRTAELKTINARLEQEIVEGKKKEKYLRLRESELNHQSSHLEEVNTALKVLLKQRENDRNELEEAVLANVKELVIPYIERVKKGQLSNNQKSYLNILESNLNNIISPFIKKLSSSLFTLSPMEIKVANYIKEGMTTDEIAELLYVSTNTVLTHRYHLRTKLGLKNKKINMRTYLKSLETTA